MLSAGSSFALGLASRGRSGGVIINEHTLTRAHTRVHVATLARWFDLIGLADLPDRLERPRAKPFCLLTFDDGKRSNAVETAAELERLGVPAVFFVVTGFLSDGAPLWFDRYAALRRSRAVLPPGLRPEVVKRLPHDLLLERLDRACARYGAAVDSTSDDIRPMTWEDARSLHRRGFAVGAHGATHAILTVERRSDALASIGASIAQVSETIGAPCESFAFPNGNHTAELAQHAVRCGARFVMTTVPTWVDAGCPMWRLPRIQLFGGDGRAKIELKLSVAATGRVLANPDGTGRLYTRLRHWSPGGRFSPG